MFASMKVPFQTHTSSSLDRQRRVKVRVGVPTAVASPDRPRPYSQEQACLPPPPGSFFSGHVFPQCVSTMCLSVRPVWPAPGRAQVRKTNRFPQPRSGRARFDQTLESRGNMEPVWRFSTLASLEPAGAGLVDPHGVPEISPCAFGPGGYQTGSVREDGSDSLMAAETYRRGANQLDLPIPSRGVQLLL